MIEERLKNLEASVAAEIAAIRSDMTAEADIPYPWDDEPEATHAVQDTNGQVWFCVGTPTPHNHEDWVIDETYFTDGALWHAGPKLRRYADYTKTLRKRPEDV